MRTVYISISNRKTGEVTNMLRLFADEGKALTDGINTVPVIDVQSSEVDLWTEIDAPVEEPIEEPIEEVITGDDMVQEDDFDVFHAETY